MPGFGDLVAFYQQCQETLRLLPPASWLTLSDVEGQLLFNTRVPYGTSLPRKAAGASGALALAEDLAHRAALAPAALRMPDSLRTHGPHRRRFQSPPM